MCLSVHFIFLISSSVFLPDVTVQLTDVPIQLLDDSAVHLFHLFTSILCSLQMFQSNYWLTQQFIYFIFSPASCAVDRCSNPITSWLLSSFISSFHQRLVQLTDVPIQLLVDSAVSLFNLFTSILSLRDPHGSSLPQSPSSLPLLHCFISLLPSSLMATLLHQFTPFIPHGFTWDKSWVSQSAHHIYLIAASSPECAVASLAGPSHFICCSK